MSFVMLMPFKGIYPIYSHTIHDMICWLGEMEEEKDSFMPILSKRNRKNVKGERKNEERGMYISISKEFLLGLKYLFIKAPETFFCLFSSFS